MRANMRLITFATLVVGVAGSGLVCKHGGSVSRDAATRKCTLAFENFKEDAKLCDVLASTADATCRHFSAQICQASRKEHSEKCSWTTGTDAIGEGFVGFKLPKAFGVPKKASAGAKTSDPNCYPVLVPKNAKKFTDCMHSTHCQKTNPGNGKHMHTQVTTDYFFVDETSGCVYCPAGKHPSRIEVDSGPIVRNFWRPAAGRADGTLQSVVHCGASDVYHSFPNLADLEVRNNKVAFAQMSPPAQHNGYFVQSGVIKRKTITSNLFQLFKIDAAWTSTCTVYKVASCYGAKGRKQVCASTKRIAFLHLECAMHPSCKWGHAGISQSGPVRGKKYKLHELPTQFQLVHAQRDFCSFLGLGA